MTNLSEIKIMSQANFDDLSALDQSKLYFVEAGAVVKETVISGTSGYIVFTSGACIQWGQVSASTSGATVNLTKTYSDTNFAVICSPVGSSKIQYVQTGYASSASAIKVFNYSGSATSCWLTIGQLAEGQY